MNARTHPQAQREPRRPRTRAAGFTLIEVMIAAALAIIVIAGLAAASMSAAKTNREAATLGAPERAIHEALEQITSDLRTNNGAGAYRCGLGGTKQANGFDIIWRTYRVTLDTNGNPTPQTTCGGAEQQGTLLVRGMTTDGNAQHTRETIVSLNHGAAPVIANFTSNLTEVRPGDTITLTWRLEPNPPAGTTTYLGGDRVTTNPSTLTGSANVRVTETTDFQLVADSPYGSDEESITVTAGNAPIFRVLRTHPERYTPGKPLTFHWEIDPAPLPLTSAARLAANGINAQALPTTPNGNGKIKGQHTVTVPPARSGTLSFPFTAASAGGDTRKSTAVRECPIPSINLTASPTSIRREGSYSTDVTVSWSTVNAATATLTVGGDHSSIPSEDVSSGSHRARLSVSSGHSRQYDLTLTAESDCGRTNSETVRVTLESYEEEPTPPAGGGDGGDDGGDGAGSGEPDEPTGPGAPPPETCDDVDIPAVIYCACSVGPPPMAVCVPQGDGADDPGGGGGGGGGGDGPPLIDM